MNLAALALPLGIVIAAAIIGYPVVRELDRRSSVLRAVLLSPIAGLSALALVGAAINRAGVPVSAFGVAAGAVLMLAALTYIALHRVRLPMRSSAAFAGVMLLAFAVIGWPLARAGFNWVSVGNADMTNYLLSANHFFAHGYYEFPPPNQLLTSSDPSWSVSFFYSYEEVRYACQLLLAWLMSVTGLPAGAVYMPMMLAFHLVVVSTTAALLYDRVGRVWTALLGSTMVAVSANLLLGTIYQLLLQDFGIALVAAFAAVFFRVLEPDRNDVMRRAALCALFISGLVIGYPEMLPFALLPAGLFVLIEVIRRRTSVGSWSAFGGILVATTLLFANTNVPGGFSFLLRQSAMAGGGAIANNVLFPYYLTPLGFAMLWGFVRLGSAGSGSLVQIGIVSGMALYAAAFAVSVYYTVRVEPIALVALTMLLLSIELFAVQSGFGLFKLAMYLQPFVLGTFAVFLVDALPGKFRLQHA